ncbi:fatty acid elongase [Novymonas esmeraldas]|uniref:Elongation of fatty acids protein n=1 Tax=Novymonas esmeraldas TaxID=1808958 RepID=A0AAW0EVG0_9TRYP
MSSLFDSICGFDGYPLQAYLLENIDVIGYVASVYLVMVGKGDRILGWWNARSRSSAASNKQNGACKETTAALVSCYTAASLYHFAVCVACAAVSCMLVPAMAQSILSHTFYDTMCTWEDARIYKGYVGFAVSAAVMVKVVEQLDTFFLVLRDYIVDSPAEEKTQVRRVQPSLWWYQVLVSLFFWHTYSIGTSPFTMIATYTMVLSAARNLFYMQQDAALAHGKTAVAAKLNRTLVAVDMAEWIGCSALSLYSSYMNYTNERGCMTMQANVRMALVLYVTAAVLRLRELLSEQAEAPAARESKKRR